MHKVTQFAATMAIGAVMLGGVYAKAYAQEDVGTKIIPSLEYQQADVREALQALFKDVGVSYSIAPEVQGQVTVSLRNITFSSALQNVLRQVDATYRLSAGVYEIVKREESQGPSDPGEVPILKPMEVVRRIRVMSADPELIAMMIGAKTGTQVWNLAPEISSLRKTNSGMGSGSMNGGMGSGSTGGMGTGSMGGLGSGGLGSGGLGSTGGGSSGHS